MNPTLHLVSFDACGQLSMVACGQLAVCGQLLRGLFGVISVCSYYIAAQLID